MNLDQFGSLLDSILRGVKSRAGMIGVSECSLNSNPGHAWNFPHTMTKEVVYGFLGFVDSAGILRNCAEMVESISVIVSLNSALWAMLTHRDKPVESETLNQVR